MIGTVLLCPRCESGHFTPYTSLRPQPVAEDDFEAERELSRADREMQLRRFPFPALSRVAPIYLCSPCGTAEAMRDFAGAAPVPPDEWPISLEQDNLDCRPRSA